jgi:hypothetical protein
MKTAIEFLIEKFSNYDLEMISLFKDEINQALEKEKEQIQKAFSDGQETPINHPTLPHYSRDEYYNDNYKPETI